MKLSNIFTFMLVAMIGVSPLFADDAATGATAKAEAETAVKTEKKAAKKPAKKTAKKAAKKPAQKAAVRKLTHEQEIKGATTPVPNKHHFKRYAEKKAFAEANKDKIKVLMLGDSITHLWEGKYAAAAQKKYLAPYGVLNLGCSGDRTQNTLWIIEKTGILELIKPQVVTIMIGTNNRDRYQATAAGVQRIVEEVRKRYPEVKILLYAIFPRGKDNSDARRIKNDKANEEIAKLCNGEDIIWVDIRQKFLTPGGILEKKVMGDFLHPKTSKSYSIWGESLLPYFEKYAK